MDINLNLFILYWVIEKSKYQKIKGKIKIQKHMLQQSENMD